MVPILAIGIILPWFITLKYISLVSAYIYLVIFTVIEVHALTAMANLLVKFDNGTNRGFIFWFITIIAFYHNCYRHELSATFIFIVKKRSEFTLNSDRAFIFFYTYFTSNSTLSNNFFTALLSRNFSAFSTIGRVKCGEKTQ